MRRRPGLADGRRRPARRPTASSGCWRETDLDFWGPLVVDEQDPDRLVFPIRLPGRHPGRARRRVGARRPPSTGGSPTSSSRSTACWSPASWSSGSATRARSSSSGATTTSTGSAPRPPAPGSRTVVDAVVQHPSVGDLGTPMMFGRTTYNHTPSDLKHYCMARNNTLNLRAYRGWPHVLLFWLKTVWFYLVHQAAAGPDRDERAGGVRRAARRLLRPREVPVMTAESVAVVVVTYNRADLLERMLGGLDALDRAPGLRDRRRQRQHRPHPRRCSSARRTPTWWRSTPTDNLGGAGGFHLGLKTAYDQGFDAMWLMDDDVVPAPDCLTRLLEIDDGCLTAVREDLPRRARREGRDAVRPRATRSRSARRRRASTTTYADRASMPATVPVDNVAFEGFLVRREVIDAIGLPDPSYFIFYDDVDFAIRARRAGFRDPRRPRRRARAPARLRPAARPGRLEGLLHVPQPVRGALPVRRERRWCGSSRG